jgi:glycosyltransferase involved in cell wall biosynthesis
MMTGLAHASGDFVFLIDSDLEEFAKLVDRRSASRLWRSDSTKGGRVWALER